MWATYFWQQQEHIRFGQKVSVCSEFLSILPQNLDDLSLTYIQELSKSYNNNALNKFSRNYSTRMLSMRERAMF
jgi:hypothetical protein